MEKIQIEKIKDYLDVETSYCLRRATEEKDQFLRNYWYEKSRIYEDLHKLIRQMQ